MTNLKKTIREKKMKLLAILLVAAWCLNQNTYAQYNCSYSNSESEEVEFYKVYASNPNSKFGVLIREEENNKEMITLRISESPIDFTVIVEIGSQNVRKFTKTCPERHSCNLFINEQQMHFRCLAVID
jgi:hypothetical protein